MLINRRFLLLTMVLLGGPLMARAAEPVVAVRNDVALRGWLENMIWHHRFTITEAAQATGLAEGEVSAACQRWKISPETRPTFDRSTLRVLPYPGGRHPRLGFLDGAVNPRRETKLSVFTPWDADSYVVADIPEALWSNLGLTYLAHTHVPTVWDLQGVKLPPLEWERTDDGKFRLERKLPNGIVVTTTAAVVENALQMSMTLTNGTAAPLSDLRVQNCVMLKGAAGFNQQTNDNKLFEMPFVACQSSAAKRWIITAWTPCDRAWGNAPCPCLHSDPKFPDCAPGETKTLRGWLSFYEGDDIQAELKRIKASGWLE